MTPLPPSSRAPASPGGEKHVVQVFEPPIGGVPAYVIALTAGLVDHGWQVDVVHPPSSALRDAVESAGATSVALSIAHGPTPGDAATVRRLSAFLATRRPRLVHSHSTKAGSVAGIACRLASVPSVYTPHGWAFERRDIGRSMRFMYASLERGLARWCHTAVRSHPGAREGKHRSPKTRAMRCGSLRG